MSLAMLNYDVDGPGIISIKWESVASLKSNRVFEIFLRNGIVVVGSIDSAFFTLYGIVLDDIIEISPIKDKFLRRLSGDMDIGFSYTKSSKILQFNLGTGITYRMPRLELGMKFNSVITNSSGDSDLTKKQDFTVDVLRYFDNHYYVIGQLGWQQNSELGLSSRYLLNAAGGKELIVDNHNRLLAAGGFSFNTEESIENHSYVGNIDALLIVQYKKFYYSSPKLSLDASFVVYPGLTEWGRVRTELNFKSKIEIVKDFFIGLTFYDNYDSKPPEGAASKNDYGVNFSLGYTFGK